MNEITITLPYGRWMYLLGWCEAHRTGEETITLTDIFTELGQAMREPA
jgi:hypothetical protein